MNTQVQAVDFTSFVFAQGDDIKTTSLLIAEKFSKSHTHVLRDIEKIMTQVSDIFNKTNFGLIEVDVKVGFGTRKDKGYELTKDGFIMVVMSYTGAKAFAIKEAYINAFNLMHAKLFPKPKPFNISTMTEKERRKMVVARWCWLIDIYGTQVTNQYGDDIPQVWQEELETMTPKEFRRGINAIKNSNSPYMPKLPVFLAYCRENQVVVAKDRKDLIDVKNDLLPSCESRADIMKHVEYNEARINAFEDLLDGMKRSNEAFKGILKA